MHLFHCPSLHLLSIFLSIHPPLYSSSHLILPGSLLLFFHNLSIHASTRLFTVCPSGHQCIFSPAHPPIHAYIHPNMNSSIARNTHPVVIRTRRVSMLPPSLSQPSIHPTDVPSSFSSCHMLHWALVAVGTQTGTPLPPWRLHSGLCGQTINKQNKTEEAR